jgi:predicted Zn-dependent protease
MTVGGFAGGTSGGQRRIGMLSLRGIKRFVTPLVLVALTVMLALVSCAKVPITGRSQLNLIPSSEMLSMSESQYSDFLKQNKISDDKAATEQVNRVGNHLKEAVVGYMDSQGMGDRIKDYKWEMNLVESKEVNAWCMPGGKVVVYTGILPVTRTDAGLAVVLGHEIGHAIAQHGSERMTEGLMAQMGGVALGEALKSRPAQTQQLWMQAFGAGAQYGALLPFSRLQESEADRIGLVLMAKAGYDPKEAVTFWQRMQSSGGEKPPELMSTHPSDERRIADIKKEIPEAMKYYKK